MSFEKLKDNLYVWRRIRDFEEEKYYRGKQTLKILDKINTSAANENTNIFDAEQLETHVDNYIIANGASEIDNRDKLATYLNDQLGYSFSSQFYVDLLSRFHIIENHLEFTPTLGSKPIIRFENHTELDMGASDFAIELLVKYDFDKTRTDWQTLMTTLKTSEVNGDTIYNGGFSLQLKERELRFQVGDGLGGSPQFGLAEILAPTTSASNTEWNHIVVQKSGNTPSAWKVSINGADTALTSSSPVMSSGNISDDEILQIGSHEGQLKDLRVFKRLLSEGEIERSFNFGLGNTPYTSSNLNFDLPLDEGYGNVVYERLNGYRGELFLSQKEVMEYHDPIFTWKRSKGYGMSPGSFITAGATNTDLLQTSDGGTLSLNELLTVKELNWAKYGLDFNGSVDVDVPMSGDLAIGMSDFTVEAWFQVSASATLPIADMVLVSNLMVSGTHWKGFSVGIENNLPTFILGDTVGHLKMNVNQPVVPGVWTHVSFTKIGTNPSNFQVAINGVTMGTTVVSNTLSSADLTGTNLGPTMIGSRRGSLAPTDGYFEGIISCARVHLGILSPTDLADTFAAGPFAPSAFRNALLTETMLDRGHDSAAHVLDMGSLALIDNIYVGSTSLSWIPEVQVPSPYTGNEIDYAHSKLSTQITSLKSIYDDSLSRIDAYMTEFGLINDNDLVQFVDDNWVGEAIIQMYPVRIETKFAFNEGGTDELWVRIFPDALEVNSHEEQLTLTEIRHGQDFWNLVGDASAITDDEEDAWKTITAVYGEKRGNYIVITTKPVNYDDAGFTVATAIWPDLEPKLETITRPPKSRILPDKFTVSLLDSNNAVIVEKNTEVISDNLKVGLDPDENSLTFVDDDIQINEMDWLLDFDTAIDKGMALKIRVDNTSPSLGNSSSGYAIPKIVVSGLKVSMSKEETQVLLEDTFKGHFYSGGISLLRNASSTKNTAERKADFAKRTDSDTKPEPIDPANYDTDVTWDGKKLATILGLRPSLFESVTNSDTTDVQDAQNMNDVLFSATIGYYLNNLLSPWLELPEVEKVRDFFSKNVVARGPGSPFRLNKAPYGVLPITDFANMSFSSAETGDHAFLNNLKAVLVDHLYPHWDAKKDNVKHAGKAGEDAKEVFADIIGRHAISVDIKKRLGSGPETIWNNLVFNDRVTDAQNWHSGQTAFAAQVDSGMGGLKGAFSKTTDPDINFLNFLEAYEDMDMPVVDDYKLSRKRELQKLGTSSWNYMEWFVNASLTEIIDENFAPIGATKPNALLYELLRLALLEEYYQAAANIHGPNYDTSLKRKDHELVNFSDYEGELPAELNQNDVLVPPDSRWVIFDEDLPGQPVGTTFRTLIDTGSPTGYETDLARVQTTLDLILRLSSRPTEELNNMVMEHMDLCSHRLDAWMTGLVTQRITNIYDGKDEEKVHGIFFGGYGWVNNLESAPRANYDETQLPSSFLPAGFDATSIEIDDDNGGYIQAPSINHAVAAAVLRSGYLSRAHNGTPDQKNRMSINLDSKRVREAKTLIEGLNNGQSLGAMIGYFFERKVHDSDTVGLNQYIYPLRTEFPFETVETTPSTDGEKAATLSVVDGLAMLKEYRTSLETSTTKFQTDYSVPSDITDIIEETEGIVDALGDLAVAEGMFQIAQSSAAGASNMTKAISEGGYIREADVINTPRKGISVTNRMMLGFPRVGHPTTTLDTSGDPWYQSHETVRSQAEPSLNQWLKDLIKDPNDIGATVTHYEGDPKVKYLDKLAPTYHRVSGRTIIADEADFDNRKQTVQELCYIGNDTDYLDVSAFVTNALTAKAYVHDTTSWSDNPVFLSATAGNVQSVDDTNKRIILKNGFKYKSITVFDDGVEKAFYHCEESNGGSCFDQSGQNNHADINASSLSAFHSTDAQTPFNYLASRGFNQYLTFSNFKSSHGVLIPPGNDWSATIKGVAAYDSANSLHALISGTTYIHYTAAKEVAIYDGTTLVKVKWQDALGNAFTPATYHEVLISKGVFSSTGSIKIEISIDGIALPATVVDSAGNALPATFACPVQGIGNRDNLTQFYRSVFLNDNTTGNDYILVDNDLSQVVTPTSETGTAGDKYTINMVLDNSSTLDLFDGNVDYYGKIHANVVNNPCLTFNTGDHLTLDSTWDLNPGLDDLYVEAIVSMPNSISGTSRINLIDNEDLDAGIQISIASGLIEIKTTENAGVEINTYTGTTNLLSTYGGAEIRLGVLLNRSSKAYVFVNGKCVDEFDISASAELDYGALTKLMYNESSTGLRAACLRIAVLPANELFKSNVDTINWASKGNLYVPFTSTYLRDLLSARSIDLVSTNADLMDGSRQDFYSSYALYGLNDRYTRFDNKSLSWSGSSVNAVSGTDNWEVEITCVPSANSARTEWILSGLNSNLRFVENGTILQLEYIDDNNVGEVHKFGQFLLDEVNNKVQRIRLEKNDTSLSIFSNGQKLDPENVGTDDVCSNNASFAADLGNSSNMEQFVSRFVVRNTSSGTEFEHILVDSGRIKDTNYSEGGTGSFTEKFAVHQVPGGTVDIFGNASISHPSGPWLYNDLDYKVTWATNIRGRERSELDKLAINAQLSKGDTQYIKESLSPTVLWQNVKEYVGLNGESALSNESDLCDFINLENELSLSDNECIELLKSLGIISDTLTLNNDYIDFGDRAEFALGANDFTISLWAKMDANIDQGDTLISNRKFDGVDTYNGGLLLRANTVVDKLQFILSEGSGTWVNGIANAQVDLPSKDAWHHIVWVRKGNDATNWLCYIDGLPQVVSVVQNNLTTGDISDRNSLKVGSVLGGHPSTTGYFNGDIKQVKIFEQEITAVDAQTLYADPDGLSTNIYPESLIFSAPIKDNGNQISEEVFGQDGTLQLSSNTWVRTFNTDVTSIRHDHSIIFQTLDQSDRISDVVINPLVQTYNVTLDDINIQPIDLVYLSSTELDGDSELSQIIKSHLFTAKSLPSGSSLIIDYSDSGSKQLSFGELHPLNLRLNKLVASSKALSSSDITPSGNDETNTYDFDELYNRVGVLQSSFNAFSTNLSTYSTAISSASPANSAFDNARDIITMAREFGMTAQTSFAPTDYSDEAKGILSTSLTSLESIVSPIAAKVQSEYTAISSTPTADQIDAGVKSLLGVVEGIMGRGFKVLPHFINGTIESNSFAKQLAVESTLMDDHSSPDDAVETWFQGVAKVRKELKSFELVKMLHEGLNLDFDTFKISPFQFPYDDDDADRWMAVKVTDEENMKHGRLCLAYITPENFDASQSQVGLLVDEWVELIPERIQDTGIAFHHNQPNSKAPKCILSLLAPVSTVNWEFTAVKTILASTLDRLKTRTLDFEDLSDTPVGQMAPMLVFRS